MATQPHNIPIGDDPLEPRPTRVLIAHPSSRRRRQLRDLLEDATMRIDSARTMGEALDAVDQHEYEVAVVLEELPDGDGVAVARRLAAAGDITRVVLLSRHPNTDLAVSAMRAGAVDLLADPPDEGELIASVCAAADAAEDARRKRFALNALLEHSRAETEPPRDDLDELCAEVLDEPDDFSPPASFETLAASELDIEALLRKLLERILAESGSTNAAVFLPGETEDFNLGAYVNYDCPRESAEMLLDHMTDILAHRFKDEPDVVMMRDDDELAAWLGHDATWIANRSLVVSACREGGECMAVIALFRDHDEPYDDDVAATLRHLGGVFARQLSRIVRVHHRMLRDEPEWGWRAEGDDEGGIAA